MLLFDLLHLVSLFYEWLLWPAVLSTAGRLPSGSGNSSACVQYSNIEVLPGVVGGGGWVGSHVAHLNFKTSRVGVYNASHCWQKLNKNFFLFFVFVGILENGNSDVL